MDSSSRLQRLQAILGQLRVDASEMSPEDWFQVITATLDRYKSHLKYLQGFRPLKEGFNCATSNSGYHYRRTEMKMVEFPDGVDGDTKCLWVARISRKTEGENKWDGASQGCRFVEQHDLYLTTRGEFLFSDYKYERVVRGGLGFRRHRIGVDDVAVWWKFTLLTDDDLRSMLKPEVGCSILDVLIKCGEVSVAERRRHLRAVEGATQYAYGLRQSISYPRQIF